MFKKTIQCFVASVLLVVAIGVSASVTSKAPKVPRLPQVAVYAKANSKKVLFKRPLGYRFVPFFKEKQWLKVGDPQGGQVGWVNLQQVQSMRQRYVEARRQYLKHHSQSHSVVIFSETRGDGKHQVTKVDAYKNGKRLSNKDAKSLYQSWQNHDHQDAHLLWPNMGASSSRMIANLGRLFDDYGFNFGAF